MLVMRPVKCVLATSSVITCQPCKSSEESLLHELCVHQFPCDLREKSLKVHLTELLWACWWLPVDPIDLEFRHRNDWLVDSPSMWSTWHSFLLNPLTCGVMVLYITHCVTDNWVEWRCLAYAYKYLHVNIINLCDYYEALAPDFDAKWL
jgi:hypothetical protein